MRFRNAFWMVVPVLACTSEVEFPGGAGGSTSGTPAATTGSGGGSNATGTGAGTSAGGAEPGCQWSADSNPCGDGFYCNAPDCVSGSCEPVSMTVGGAKAEVCGCDNVNYWNATTASNYGMAVASIGACAQPLTCTMDMKCPTERHFCAQLLNDPAGCLNPGVNGVCWGMPKECPPIAIGGTWRRCANGMLEPCVDECEAIKAQRKSYPDLTCPQ